MGGQGQRVITGFYEVLAVAQALVGHVNVNVNNLLAISISDFDNSGEPGPQAKGVNHLETPLRQLHVTHRASSCAKRGGHGQLCSKPRGARGIEPETFGRRGQLLSRPPTTGPRFCECHKPMVEGPLEVEPNGALWTHHAAECTSTCAAHACGVFAFVGKLTMAYVRLPARGPSMAPGGTDWPARHVVLVAMGLLRLLSQHSHAARSRERNRRTDPPP